MPETCLNCGAELYEGQQFCRRCGVQVGVPAEGGEAPTQLFAPGAQPAPNAAAASGTSHVRGETAQVGAQQPTAYHPRGSFQQTSPLVGEPFGSRPLAVGPNASPRGGRRGVWLLALLAVFVLGAGVASAGAFLWWRAAHRPVVKIVKTGPPPPGVPDVPPVPDIPELPADLAEQIKQSLKSVGVPLPIDESGAVVSGDETVLTRAYNLGSDSSFSAHVTNGNVTVVGGEGEQAVVKIIKHGGSVQERASARVLAAESEEGVALISAAPSNGRVTVSYEIAVPRDLKRLELSVDKGDLRVTEFGGAVESDVKMGDVEFRSVSGAVRSRVMKGNTRVLLPAEEREGAQQFSVIKGDIEATLPDGAGADLKAETIDGDIDVDGSFGLNVQKAPAGRHVAGHLGEGGEALLLKVTNGDIRVKK
jgi:hypothetical protein